MDTRGDEIHQLINIGQQILRIRQQGFIHEVGQMNIDFGGTENPIDLDTIFRPNGPNGNGNLPGNYRADYAICNNTGEELRRDGNELEGQIVGGKNVRIR